MHRSLHWKRLLVVVAVLVLFGGTLFAINKVQVQRQSSIVKQVAEKAEAGIDNDNERRANAISLYATYLKFQPQDEEAFHKFAKLNLDQYKADPEPKTIGATIAGLELFLRRFPSHTTERRELADIYIKIGKIRNAREHIEVLFNSRQADFKNDVEVLEMAALCEELAGENANAIKYLEDAINTEKAPVRIYQKVLVLLNSNKIDRSDTKIANHIRTLKENPRFRNDLEARIVVARFELYRREFENARGDIEFARKEIPGGEENPEVLMAAAEWEISGIHSNADMKPKLAAARAILERANKKDPLNVQIGLFLARILESQGEKELALNTLRETAKAFGPINDQYWVLIDYLIDLKNKEFSASLVDRAATNGKSDSRLTYFRGRLALLDSDWLTAKKLLEEAAPNLVKLTEHHKRAMIELGIIYGVLQNPDQQLSYFRSALRDDGSNRQALIGEAEALARLGRLDEAITRYQSLVTAYQIPELRPTLARIRLMELLRRPAEKRDWSKFDSEDTFGPEKDRPSELAIIYAQGLSIRGDRAKAIQILNDVIKNEKNPTIASTAWVTLARIQAAGKPEAAILVLEDAQKQLGDTVELRLARAEALIFRNKPPTVAEYEALKSGIEKFSKNDQFRLWFGLGQTAVNTLSRFQGKDQEDERNSMQEAALRYLRKAIETDARNLPCRATLIDLAIKSNHRENIEAAIDDIGKLEGPNGPISMLSQVCIRLDDVKKLPNSESQLALIHQLREQMGTVQHQRPGWGRVYVVLGQLDELEGLIDQAIEHYHKALTEGDRDEGVIRRTVTLYRERKQDAQAAGMLDELSTKMVLPEDLERYRTIFAMLNQVVPQSERPTIDRIAPSSSKDSRILLLRGALLSAIRDDAEALLAFRGAVDIASDNPETWEAVIRQLARTGDFAGAKDAMKKAEKRLLDLSQKNDVAKANLLLALGLCQELCGDMKAAANHYKEALGLAPKELSVNRRLVEFLLRVGQQGEADTLLDRLSKDASQDLARWSRRYFAAFTLMARPDAYQQRHRALDLIKQNLDAAPNDPEDIKAQAIIYTVDPATREEGVRILKDHWDKGALTPDESFHLGMLIFSLGPNRISESIKFFESAAKPRPEVTTEHIAGLIRVYVAWDRLDLAEETLKRLKAVSPYGWETVREEARLLKKKGQLATIRGDRDEGKKRSDQALEIIKNYKGHNSQDMIRTKTGPLLVELGFYDEAERLYRDLMKLADSPTAHIPLALLYIQAKRTSDAIKLARECEAKAPLLLTAQILAGAVRVKRPGLDVEKDVEAWLDDKIRKYAGKPELGGLVAARAELYDAQAKYDEAIEEYQKAIDLTPSDLAVNNLAMILTLRKRSVKEIDQAIQLITKVIEIRGPVPTYLDTRAVAYLVKGGEDTIEKAVQDLTMARLQQSRSIFAYHLAWAYDLQQKRNDRDRMLDEAKKIGIDPDDLHPLERDKFTELFSQYAK